MLLLFYPRGNRPLYSLGGPHSWPGRYGEQKNLLPVAGLERRFLGRRQQGTLMLKLISNGDVFTVERLALLLRMGLQESLFPFPVFLASCFVLFLSLGISLLSAR
jgi:hypothetical protein